MTTFKGPVNIGAGRDIPTQGTAAYVTIDVSGTSRFTEGLVIIGPGNALGRVDLVQVITAAGTLANAAAGANIRMPPNSVLFDASFIMTVGVSQASAGNSAANIFVSSSANEGSFLRIPVSGAAGVFRVLPANICAANALNTGANGTEVYLTVNSQGGTAGSDISPLSGLLMLQYVRRA